MTTLVGFVVPVDEVVNVRYPDQGQIVIEGDLKGLLRIGAAIGYFDSVQKPLLYVVSLKVSQLRPRVERSV